MDLIPQLGMLGYTEVLPILAVVIILFGSRRIPDLARRLGSGADEFGRPGFFKRAVQGILDELGKDPKLRHHSDFTADMKQTEPVEEMRSPVTRWFVVWLAQGFGIGRIPWAPGTFGSILGLGWFAVLLMIAQWNLLAAGLIFVASIFAAVPTCEAAEIILGKKDPGSVVLDEIVALPTCFLGWVFHLGLQLKTIPTLDFFFGQTTWYLAFGVFLAFRFFDVVKPWPVRQSQDLPHGWGVVVDDQLAAVYVNFVVMAIHIGLQFLR